MICNRKEVKHLISALGPGPGPKLSRFYSGNRLCTGMVTIVRSVLLLIGLQLLNVPVTLGPNETDCGEFYFRSSGLLDKHNNNVHFTIDIYSDIDNKLASIHSSRERSYGITFRLEYAYLILDICYTRNWTEFEGDEVSIKFNMVIPTIFSEDLLTMNIHHDTLRVPSVDDTEPSTSEPSTEPSTSESSTSEPAGIMGNYATPTPSGVDEAIVMALGALVGILSLIIVLIVLLWIFTIYHYKAKLKHGESAA